MEIVRLYDVPKLPYYRFTGENSVRYNRIASPVYLDLPTGYIVIDKGFKLIGWCDSISEYFMYDREGQIVIMIYDEEYGEEIWEHFPLIDADEREDAKFYLKEGQRGF